MLIGPITLESSKVNTLFTTPLIVIGATPNVFVWPNFMFIVKDAGAYTIAGVTGIQLKWSRAGVAISGAILATTMGFADESGVSYAKANNLISFLDDVQLYYNADIAVSLTGANTSGAGGKLNIMLDVTLFPATFSSGVIPARELTLPDRFIS